jgi:hypothetical protein
VRSKPESAADALFAELLRAGTSVAALREVLERHDPDDNLLLDVLHRAVPVPFLEALGTTSPWSTRGRVLGGVVLNPKVPRALALRLLPALFWRDLADVARTPRVDAGVRVRAEGLLKDLLPELRLGEKVTLGRLATPPILALLLRETDAKALEAALTNPRLREEDVLVAVRRETVSPALLAEIAASRRWTGLYSVRLELVLQKRTPLAVALAQLSSLLEKDLRRIAATPELTPLVQVAALRVAEASGGRDGAA